jgi:hypothetical protein
VLTGILGRQFFLAVAPSCCGFIAYSSWVAVHFRHIIRRGITYVFLSAPPPRYYADAGSRLEFLCLGMHWIYTFLTAASLLAMVIKIVFFTKRTVLGVSVAPSEEVQVLPKKAEEAGDDNSLGCTPREESRWSGEW